MLLLAMCCAAAGAVHPAPVSPALTADVVSRNIFSGSSRTEKGIVTYDRFNQRQARLMNDDAATRVPVSWEGTPKAVMLTSNYYLGLDVFLQLNDRNYPQAPQKAFPDMFAWVPATSFVRNTTINNIAVQEYFLKAPSGTFYYYSTPDGVPVRTHMNLTIPGLPGQPPVRAVLQDTFSNVSYTVDPTVFTSFNKTAGLDPPVCAGPSNPPPVTLDMYIFHPRDNATLVNQNTADIMGDTNFVCLDALSNHTAQDHYDVASWYKVEVLPVWGQYQLCNGYPGDCMGAENKRIGRELAFGVTQFGGQCNEEDANEVGVWWSMPADGECKEGQVPSEGVCSWRVVRRVKTIDAVKCLFGELGMLDSCRKEQRPPYPVTSDMYRRAFTEDSVAQRGCPPINP
eukprot:TRINITY_DN326_c0_g1_i13.p1 TRINITY_DN326_c0_g1~~TRINITY_DN326_c0_g1_i13.p1  ORF type:complete len:417 (+),score=118.66 TRINITY_DN326_c0_g1_i13:58-1251(+)